MTTVFNIALEKRFTDSEEITSIDVTASDRMLIRNSETGVVMKMPFSVLQAALLSAQQAALDLKANKALDAITYIQAGEFLNSWTNYTGNFPDAGYFKDQFGIVHLTGLIKSGTIGTEAFTLPVGYRPSKYIYLPAGGAQASVIRISPDGGVRVNSGSNSYVSLDNVQFRIL